MTLVTTVATVTPAAIRTAIASAVAFVQPVIARQPMPGNFFDDQQNNQKRGHRIDDPFHLSRPFYLIWAASQSRKNRAAS